MLVRVVRGKILRFFSKKVKIFSKTVKQNAYLTPYIGVAYATLKFLFSGEKI